MRKPSVNWVVQLMAAGILACLVSIARAAAEDSPASDKEMRGIAEKLERIYVDGFNREDANAASSVLHSNACDSLGWFDKESLNSQFRKRNDRLSLASLEFIAALGTDGKMFMARVVIDAQGEDPKPLHTRSDIVRVYKRDDGEWKIYGFASIGFHDLNLCRDGDACRHPLHAETKP